MLRRFFKLLFPRFPGTLNPKVAGSNPARPIFGLGGKPKTAWLDGPGLPPRSGKRVAGIPQGIPGGGDRRSKPHARRSAAVFAIGSMIRVTRRARSRPTGTFVLLPDNRPSAFGGDDEG